LAAGARPKAYYTRRLDPRPVRPSIAALAAALCFTAGCGYIGSPLPPYANVPSPVANLAAVQRGDKIIAQFTVPTLTTEGQPLKPPVTLDLRIGERRFTPAAVNGGTARYEIPAAEWTGTNAGITARAVGSNGKASVWCAPFIIAVVGPPEAPRGIAAESTAQGVRLTWQAKGGHFHVLRMAGTETEYKLVAPDVAQTEWVDSTAEFGKPYSYLVQTFVPLAGGREAQSDLPEARSITPEAPPPGVPAGLRAVSGAASIELSWDTPEGAAPAGYRVYRAIADGAFAKIGEAGAAPAYSDKAVEAGKVYRYAVSAMDASGREGPRCAPAEAGLQ